MSASSLCLRWRPEEDRVWGRRAGDWVCSVELWSWASAVFWSTFVGFQAEGCRYVSFRTRRLDVKDRRVVLVCTGPRARRLPPRQLVLGALLVMRSIESASSSRLFDQPFAERHASVAPCRCPDKATFSILFLLHGRYLFSRCLELVPRRMRLRKGLPPRSLSLIPTPPCCAQSPSWFTAISLLRLWYSHHNMCFPLHVLSVFPDTADPHHPRFCCPSVPSSTIARLYLARSRAWRPKRASCAYLDLTPWTPLRTIFGSVGIRRWRSWYKYEDILTLRTLLRPIDP